MDLSPVTFDELRRLIHRLCGLVIADDKEYLIRHRLESLVKSSGCRSFDDFLGKLTSPDSLSLQEAVVEAITTQETSFFRDRHPFEAIRDRILPEMASSLRIAESPYGRRKIRVMCCGASTGQEPYSLAMLISEYSAMRPSVEIAETDFSILAIDISTNALATAAAAKYSQREIDRGLTPEQVRRFFEREGDHWILKPSLRRLVEFRHINLMQPFAGLGTFHLILCRNVLIYFDLAARQRICTQFYEMLAGGGWLVLGSAESLLGIDHQFQSLRHGDTLLFRKP
jgi:chemotaxis protein methyltransferase CheR